jgi:hypothetical protein
MTDKTTFSIQLDELTLEQLVQLSQGIGREIDKLREQRAYLKAKIDARLAGGERTSTDPTLAQDATAPGAVIEASAAT